MARTRTRGFTLVEVLVALFVLAIGPANYFLLRKRKRLHLLIVTVPLSAVATLTPTVGPLQVTHLGQVPSVTISFNLAIGTSLGSAVDEVQRVADVARTRPVIGPVARRLRRGRVPVEEELGLDIPAAAEDLAAVDEDATAVRAVDLVTGKRLPVDRVKETIGVDLPAGEPAMVAP